MAKFWWNTKSIIRGFSPISGNFSWYEILILLKCAVDSDWSDAINFIVSCLVVELFIHDVTKNSTFNGQKHSLQNISTSALAMTKSFLLFYWAQDGETTNMNCLVYLAFSVGLYSQFFST